VLLTIGGTVRVGITGGRRDERGRVLIPSLWQLHAFWELAYIRLGMVSLRHGGAIGTDRIVAEYVSNKNYGFDTISLTPPIPIWVLRRMAHNPRVIPIISHPVDVRIDGPWPQAGHHRNTRMLEAHPHTEVLIAFPGGRGTAHCVETGLRMGIAVWQWEGDREKGEFREIAR
jgi:hypothetical protein